MTSKTEMHIPESNENCFAFKYEFSFISLILQDAEKEKQLKEAKNIQLRKRKALADLFKYLAQIGESSF